MKTSYYYSTILILGFIGSVAPAQAQTWNTVSSPQMGNPQHFTVYDNELFVATAAAGPHKTTDGENWTQKKNGLDGFGTQGAGIDGLDSWLYYGSKKYIHRSTDGESWDTAGTGIQVNANNYARWFYKFDDTYFCIMSAAITNGGGIYRSSDGENWTLSTTGMAANNTCLKMTKIGGKLYVGTNLDFFESTDNGMSWTSALPGKAMLHNGFTEYKGRWMMFTTLGVIYSDNQGGDWKESENDPRGTIQCGFIDGPNDTLFSWAASSGIFYSLDTGATWTDYSSNLSSNDKLFMQDVVLYKNSLYMSTLLAVKSNASSEPVSVKTLSNANIQVNVYPNPATDNIIVSIPQLENEVTMNIVDVLGNVIQTDVINTTNTTCNLNELIPGVYFIEIKDEESSESLFHTRLIKN